jgi:mannosyltransferase
MIRRVFARLRGWSLALVLGLALLVRLVRIDTRGLQYDDVFSIFLSARNIAEIIRGTAADTMPPLYYLGLHVWGLLSQADWYLRLLSVFLSLLAVALLYSWVLALSEDRRAALLAALLMAISPFQYYHAQDVRNYALLLCCQLGYMLSFTRIWQNEKQGRPLGWGNWAGFGLCALAAMYTHNVAALGLALPNLFLLFGRRWRLLLRACIAQGLVGLLTLPWLIQLPQQLAKVQRAWSLWRPGLVDVMQIPVVWSAGLPLPGWWLFIGALLGIEILALLAVEAWRGHRERGVGMLALTAAALPAIFFVLSYLMRPIFVPRGFILSSAAYLGLAGWAVSKGWKRGAGKLLLGGFILAAGVGLPAQAGFASFPRSPFEAAGGALEQMLQPGEMILHDNKLSYFPMRYYHPELPQVFLADMPGSGNDTFAGGSQEAMQIFPARDLEAAVGDSSGLYFVVFSQAIQEYQAAGQAEHPVMAWLDDHFRRESSTVFKDLEVTHYVRP